MVAGEALTKAVIGNARLNARTSASMGYKTFFFISLSPFFLGLLYRPSTSGIKVRLYLALVFECYHLLF